MNIFVIPSILLILFFVKWFINKPKNLEWMDYLTLIQILVVTEYIVKHLIIS